MLYFERDRKQLPVPPFPSHVREAKPGGTACSLGLIDLAEVQKQKCGLIKDLQYDVVLELHAVCQQGH